MATGTIKNTQKITQLTTTYTSNSYVSETNFNRITAYEINGIVILKCNLAFSASFPTGTDDLVIGKINLTKNLQDSFYFTTAPRDSFGTYGSLQVTLTASGNIQLTNRSGKPCNSWYRCEIVAV